MQPEQKHPLVEVYHSIMDGELWDLFIIPICPYCNFTHSHGAPKSDKLKIGEQGWKRPHCSGGIGGPDYRIVYLGKSWPKSAGEKKKIIDDLKARGLTSKIGEWDENAEF